jgi:hypothetical protein
MPNMEYVRLVLIMMNSVADSESCDISNFDGPKASNNGLVPSGFF